MSSEDRTCTCCGETKPLSEFYKRGYAKPGWGRAAYSSHCKECMRTYRKQYRADNPEIVKATEKRKQLKRKANGKLLADHIKRLYGMEIEQFNTLFDSQDGKCAICNEDQSNARVGRLYVDHCHETGKIRGLLCHKCNSGLGAFKDDSELIKRAFKYLKGQL